MASAHVRSGWPSVIPRLFVEDPEEAVRFLKELFDADGEFNSDGDRRAMVEDPRGNQWQLAQHLVGRPERVQSPESSRQ